jgi:2-oxo-4-hydroxy-4-carboxy-5-ureidoimidazoline decarboxylase
VGLDAFNALDRDAARAALRPCVDIDRWIDEVVDGRPYADVEAALAAGRLAAEPWTESEIDGALAHHPRIGDRPQGASAEATFSRSEQAGVDVTDADVQAALVSGNLAYEDRFGRVFLIRAAGRSSREILDALNARLLHSPDEELPVVAQQLREIAVLRLEGVLNA